MKQLELKHFKYSYKDGDRTKTIIRDLSTTFEKGKLYAISGPSGCGKTTLAYCIGGLDRNYEGSILYDGKNIKDIDQDLYRRKYSSIIFQNYNLIDYYTAVENIQIALEIAKVDLKRSQIRKELSVFGINKEKSERKVSSLSGGEQQRIAIVRAILLGNDLLIADEPTGNLDHDMADIVMNDFVRIAHENNRCIIMITHNPVYADMADEIIDLTHADR